MPYRTIFCYSESFLTVLFNMVLSVSFKSTITTVAGLLSIMRLIYLIRLDIIKNHKGNIKEWFRVLVKKNKKI